jgi:hypothetical protein
MKCSPWTRRIDDAYSLELNQIEPEWHQFTEWNFE